MARLRYLGISFFELVTDSGKVVYIDPCISINPDCPITLQDIPRADLVLVTHMARDHSQRHDSPPPADGRSACLRPGCRACGDAGRDPAERVKVVLSGVAVEQAGIRVKALKTEHGSWSIQDGRPVFDLSLGYIVDVREGVGIYHVGDTSIFSEFELFGRLYRPTVMLTPIGMFPGAITEMDPWEAAIATAMVRPRITVPIHYDRKTQAEYPARFAQHLATESPGTEVKILAPGEVLEV